MYELSKKIMSYLNDLNSHEIEFEHSDTETDITFDDSFSSYLNHTEYKPNIAVASSRFSFRKMPNTSGSIRPNVYSTMQGKQRTFSEILSPIAMDGTTYSANPSCVSAVKKPGSKEHDYLMKEMKNQLLEAKMETMEAAENNGYDEEDDVPISDTGKIILHEEIDMEARDASPQPTMVMQADVVPEKCTTPILKGRGATGKRRQSVVSFNIGKTKVSSTPTPSPSPRTRPSSVNRGKDKLKKMNLNENDVDKEFQVTIDTALPVQIDATHAMPGSDEMAEIRKVLYKRYGFEENWWTGYKIPAKNPMELHVSLVRESSFASLTSRKHNNNEDTNKTRSQSALPLSKSQIHPVSNKTISISKSKSSRPQTASVVLRKN